MSVDFTHFLRIGIHSEADVFRRARPLYDALIVNANLVQATPAATAALVYALEKPFFIDPFTHAFILNPKYLMSKSKGKSGELKVKKSFAGLAVEYFEDWSFLGTKQLELSTLDVSVFTKRVFGFQEKVLSNAVSDVLDTFTRPELLKPSWLIAPYFPLRRFGNYEESFETNVACLEAAVSIDAANASGIVAIELDVLKQHWKAIVKRYAASKVRTLFLWIESFDEDRAEFEDLRVYCDFVKALSEAGITPINLFGGFFSCLAQGIGLGGFAHGLVYGENKSFTPVVGGGQPPPRYYLKPAHVSMNVREAEVLLAGVGAQAYLQSCCDCLICKELFSGKADLSRFARFSDTNDQGKFIPKAYAMCRFHFLFARRAEIVAMGKLTSTDRKASILMNAEFMQEIGAYDFVDHLTTWARVLTEFCGA